MKLYAGKEVDGTVVINASPDAISEDVSVDIKPPVKRMSQHLYASISVGQDTFEGRLKRKG